MIKRKVYKHLFYNPRTDELGVVVEINGLCLVDISLDAGYKAYTPEWCDSRGNGLRF